MRKIRHQAYEVRQSPIHGSGVFALREIAENERIIEYTGEIIPWSVAEERYAVAGTAGHTFFFDRGDGTVIDGGAGGNEARFVNHSCDPNCEPFEEGGRVVFYAIRTIRPGDELSIDYKLQVDDPLSAESRALYACACGAPNCRGVMLEVSAER